MKHKLEEREDVQNSPHSDNNEAEEQTHVTFMVRVIRSRSDKAI